MILSLKLGIERIVVQTTLPCPSAEIVKDWANTQWPGHTAVRYRIEDQGSDLVRIVIIRDAWDWRTLPS